MTPSLAANDLSVVRGERCLFTDVSFVLAPGQLLVLEGQNGSGKTSLLRALVGLLELESGDVRWGDAPIQSVRQEYLSSLVWLSHRVGLKADLTLIENLRFEAALRPTIEADMGAVLEQLAIDRLKKLPLRALSAGQQRRVALARLLLADAPLWLMDEPFTNLDRQGRGLVIDCVSEHLGQGGMCIVAAHQDVEINAPTQKVLLS